MQVNKIKAFEYAFYDEKINGVSMENNILNTKRYFAAANGYDGFRSNFESVFSPNKLKKLFIIKGGPGTGKSTLMRSVKDVVSKYAEVTEILCSSDIRSLDGLVIKHDGITVGIADGTAPHVLETRYPGAVDEIVNLGDGFNYRALMSCANEIIDLSKRKGIAYGKAYTLLKSAGDVHRCVDDVLLNNGAYKEAENIAREMIDYEASGAHNGFESDFLDSAFSKDGYTRLAIPNTNKRIAGISADGICEYCITSKIFEMIKPRGVICRISYSPLSRDMVETIETDSAIYTVMNSKELNVDSGILFLGHSEEYARLKKIYDDLLGRARDAFIEASKYHFMLEDIYSKNVCFDANDAKRDVIIERINEVFNK